jgi:cation diffusion facilitator CzcD-associated flavoprotein CzcO
VYEHVPGVHRLTRWLIYSLRELMAFGFMHPWLLQLAQRLAVRHLEQTVPDPELRARLTPDYTMGCKRVLISDDYLASLNHANVSLVTEKIREVREHSIVTADGTAHEVDAIIFGTGFQVQELPIARIVRGRHGHTLSEAWGGTMTAHLGTTVSGFPNFFMLMGPNTGLGHSSVLLMLESQLEHVLGALRYLEGRDLAAVEPTPEAQTEFVRYVDSKMTGTVWNQGGCSSWYLDATGRNSALWPGLISSFKRRVERFEPSEYVAITRHVRSSAVRQERTRRLAHG